MIHHLHPLSPETVPETKYSIDERKVNLNNILLNSIQVFGDIEHEGEDEDATWRYRWMTSEWKRKRQDNHVAP